MGGGCNVVEGGEEMCSEFRSEELKESLGVCRRSWEYNVEMEFKDRM
jgi:hypothetical protein